MRHNKEKGPCPCARCAAIAGGLSPEEADAQQQAWQIEALGKQGFYVHYITQDDATPTGFNAHSHGLQQYDHLDFQLIVPLPPEIGHSIISDLANRVKGGERFEPGQVLDKVVRNFNVKLIEATESDRKVLRIILPDPQGGLEPEEISERYSVQYADTPFATTKKKKPWIASKYK